MSLGCDKNTVDSEHYLAQLADAGADVTADVDDADVILVNTCGFIDAAKKESIDALVEAGRSKENGRCRAVVALGCMVQRHKEELEAALPEVDVFLGTTEGHRLIPELEARGYLDGRPALHPGVRLFTGELRHVRYLKISEGCDHGCAFCAIPLMRGKHRSFALEGIVREAQLLEAQGAREINLVAQDLAHFGRDRRDGVDLPALLASLVRETGVPLFRMLYLYSAGLTPRLLEFMASQPRVAPYLDMPIQHASDTVLARMRRPERKRSIRDRVRRIREVVPDVAIRTTCIVGFPGESDADFAELLAFLEEMRFERVGAFTYSPQEGTRANEMPDDVPDSVKRERLDRLTALQRVITAEAYEARLGRVVPAIVDRVAQDGGVIEARTLWQAHDVDGVTLVRSGPGAAALTPGDLVDVHLEGVLEDVDFAATLVRVASRSERPPDRARGRSLRVLATADTSYGRSP